MHYPTDVAGSLVVSVTAGYLTARIAMDKVLVPLITLVSRITDPVLARAAYLRPVRHTLLDPRVRAVVVATACLVIGARIVASQRTHALDEMELAVFAAWIAVGSLAVHISSQRFWRAPTAG